MSDLQNRLQSVLGSGYRIERELGGGGMSRVFLAEEIELARKVVVKVLPPDMAAGLNAERFRREIQLAASLQHPHIVPLIAAGRTGDLVWYTMPFIEGESLRAKLARERELPIPEAVRILRDVCDALSYAHGHGVVHRDIKPDNVMLTGRHAVVTDFGVAKAVSASTGESSLTSIGVALGTPSYMAPEQASADPYVDHRADIYSVGAMAYEMLTGRPPFEGAPQMVLAAQVTQAPEAVSQRRASVPSALATLVMRCLEKKAADRWQTAAELHQQLEMMATPSGGAEPTSAVAVAVPAARRRPVWVLPVAVVAVILVAAVLRWKPWASSGAAPLDPTVVGVLPFRVAGADASLHYLRQGMLDLLQAKLTGEGGPRAADARTVLAAFRDAGGTDENDVPSDGLLAIARKIGAGRLIQGSVVGPPEHVVLSATLLEMPGEKSLAQTSVQGPKDSLFAMVDHLAAQLLALGAGARTQQLSALTTTNLDALRAYLDGIVAYRSGAFEKATPLLERAVQLDSTFALATSALIEANGWHPATVDMNRVQRLAWQYRSRLAPRDQQLLSLRLGSNYPKETLWQTRIADREAATRSMPDSPEAWYYYGDGLFHYGLYSDIENPLPRAREAFEQAFRLDSLYGGPITHLQTLALVRHDTAAARLWLRRLNALGSDPQLRLVAEWGLASLTGNARRIDSLLTAADSFPSSFALRLLSSLPFDSAVRVHRDALFETAMRRAGAANRAGVISMRIMVLWNRGRPAEARTWIDSLRSAGIPAAQLAGQTLIVALFEGDTAGLGAWSGPPLPGLQGAMDMLLRNLILGDTGAIDASLRAFRAEASRADSSPPEQKRADAVLQAWAAVEAGRPAAGELVTTADSLLRGVPVIEPLDFVVARLLERLGRNDDALRVVRRRSIALGFPNELGLAAALRLEGQLAAKTGDRDRAIDAYREYLFLRDDPEPSLQPQRDSVVAELAALNGST